MLVPGFYAAARSSGAKTLSAGLNFFGYERARELRRVPENCRLIEVKAWGGGGGGPLHSSVTLRPDGGAGGYVSHLLEVTPGDVLAIEVGGGGEMGVMAPVQSGGLGGWPDGGDGGRGRNTYPASGGGGSTRLWVAGILMLVAAGGGGGGYFLNGGARGGGVVGGSTPHATGGTMFSPGTSIPPSANPTATGGYLQGGRGYSTAITAVEAGGGGGGGGYYGGGGGYYNDSLYGGMGAGGSSAVVSPYNYKPLPQFAGGGVTRIPVNITDTDYPGGFTGYGGVYAQAGYPGGLVIRVIVDDPQPVRLTQNTLTLVLARGALPVRLSKQELTTFSKRAEAPLRVTQNAITIIRTLT